MERLSYQRIQQCIAEEEIPLRLKHHPAEVVEAVYRYGAPVASRIEQLPRAGRLMSLARERIDAHEERDHSFPSGMLLIADALTESRGRFQRSWFAPPGGLWLTLVMANTLLPRSMALYPMAAGAACCEAIRGCGIDAQVKWVNDVHLAGRKICGILSESYRSRRFGDEYVLIGVGINVNNVDFPAELADLALSMKAVLGRDLDLAAFATRLLAKFSWYFGLLCHDEAEGLAGDDYGGEQGAGGLLLPAWRNLSDTIGRTVRFGFDVQRQPQYLAKVIGIAPDGGLILKQLVSGEELIEHSGEILYVD
ncbi:biotin--[acetyl-CoA-carboxylase] ligase [Thiovibrio sp. JS02]